MRFAGSSFGRSRDPPRDATLRGRQRDAIGPSNWSSIWTGVRRGSPSGALLREAHQAASSFGSRRLVVRVDGHDSVALDAAFAALPDARDSGPERKAAASGNRGQVWPRRDSRPPIRFEDIPGVRTGNEPTVLWISGQWPVMMKGAGRVNADALRATVSLAEGLRTRGWTTHRFSSPVYLPFYRADRPPRGRQRQQGNPQVPYRSRSCTRGHGHFAHVVSGRESKGMGGRRQWRSLHRRQVEQ